MPLFEYRCSQCGERFEKLHMWGDQARSAECPACGNRDVVKQYSAFAAHTSGRAGEQTSCSTNTGFG